MLVMLTRCCSRRLLRMNADTYLIVENRVQGKPYAPVHWPVPLPAAFGDDFAVAQNVGVSAYSQGFAYIVIGNQHADIALDQMPDNFLYLNDRNRVNPGKGFVEQDEIGLRGQSAGNLDAPPLTPERLMPVDSRIC